MEQLTTIRNRFYMSDRILVYRSLLLDNQIKGLKELVFNTDNLRQDQLEQGFYQVCSGLIRQAETHRLSGDLWRSYLLWLIATDYNQFSLACERAELNVSYGLYQSAAFDLEILQELYHISLAEIGQAVNVQVPDFLYDYRPGGQNETLHHQRVKELEEIARQGSVKQLVKALANFYHTCGTAEMGIYSAFRWDKEKGLLGMADFDPITFGELFGYEKQKNKLLQNTESFFRGDRANNILLYGSSGTGKSSSVKALINKYSDRGLRLIEVTREDIRDLPQIMSLLSKRGLYYIIFLDDLSFEDFEREYVYLKSLMEGGVEVKPDNVLFYATSNRRNLVKEKWSDRNSEQGEVHLTDYLQEKHSLVDRFGITIIYQSPEQQEYLEIVKGLARNAGIEIGVDELQEQALKWEMWHNGRSGRTARQFINYLSGNIHK